MKTEMRTTLLPFLTLTLTFTLTTSMVPYAYPPDPTAPTTQGPINLGEINTTEAIQQRHAGDGDVDDGDDEKGNSVDGYVLTNSTTTATTTQVPVTHRPLQNLCDNCTFQYGIGYNPHPSDCTLYIQCRQNDQGLPVVDSVRPCPHGLYWNQHKLTCDFQENVNCTDEYHCEGKRGVPGDRSKYEVQTATDTWVRMPCTPGTAFSNLTCDCTDRLNQPTGQEYNCEGKRGVPGDRTKYEVQTATDTWVLMPCVPGTAFSTRTCGCTDLLNQPTRQEYHCEGKRGVPGDRSKYEFQTATDTWVLMPCAPGTAFSNLTCGCTDLLNQPTGQEYNCEGMRGVPGDRTQYEFQTAADTWVLMPCAPGTAFSTRTCGCTDLLNQPTRQVCTPELYLPFNSDTTDQSDRYTWVQNEGVVVKDGKAFFDGRSRLLVPRFSNAWWGATVYIHLRYKSLNVTGYFGHKQTLVSNGDCDAHPSLSMCAGNRGVEFFAATTDSYQPANITVPSGTSQSDGWNEVFYKLDDNLLQGQVNDQRAQAQASGNLETRHCGLVIGGGTTCQNFEGVMDDVVVYLCRPYFTDYGSVAS